MTLKSILAGLGVAAVVIGAFFSGNYVKSTNLIEDGLGGQRAGLQSFTDGVSFGDPGVTEQWFTKKIEPEVDDFAVYHNTSGKDAVVDYGEINIITGETASSTYKLWLIASTSSSVPTTMDYATVGGLSSDKNGLIKGISIATSTTATTTSSVYAAATGAGNGAVIVPNGSYLLFFMQRDTSRCAGNAGSVCEAATSTNRGFNPRVNLRVHYLTNSQ